MRVLPWSLCYQPMRRRLRSRVVREIKHELFDTVLLLCLILRSEAGTMGKCRLPVESDFLAFAANSRLPPSLVVLPRANGRSASGWTKPMPNFFGSSKG